MRYKRKFIPNHPRAQKDNGCVYEHILVAEKILGRSLKEHEKVHHKDENKLNNSPENLIVFQTAEDHNRFHKGGVLIFHNDGTYTSEYEHNKCKNCGKNCTYGAKYCLECHLIKIAKNIPNKDLLKKLILEKPATHIAKDFNVSDKTIEKWCKKYNISKPPRGYWNKKILSGTLTGKRHDC